MTQIIRIRVAGILVRDHHVLLVRHEKTGRTYWLIPGGGVKYGESVKQALIREFKEECGLDIEIGPVVIVHDSIPPDQHRQILNLYFIVNAQSFDIKEGTDNVLKEVRFHSIDAIGGLTIYPNIKDRIIDGVKTRWAKGCQYLGNLWEE